MSNWEPVARQEAKEGDRITFRAVARWCGGGRQVRLCTGRNFHDRVTVRFGGWKNFVLRDSEIEMVERRVL